jgi:hypothetical protein
MELILSNGSDTFQDRNANGSQGEKLFVEYCQKKGYKLHRIGFDETNDRLGDFYKLNFFLRNLPDFVVDTGSGMRVVQVKGSPNIKATEYDNIPLFMSYYCSKQAMLQYAFCFNPQPNEEFKPIWVYPDTVMSLYDKGVPGVWSDGVKYRKINFDQK